MRKSVIALAAASALAASAVSPALANPHHRHHHHHQHGWVAPVAGAAVGTAVGVGLYEGWFGSNAAFASLGTTTSGAIAGGLVAGVGTVALIHAVTTPCQGFQALFMMSDGCVNGQYVGHRAAYMRR